MSLLDAHVGKEVVLHGYIQPQSNVSTKLSFAQLVDPLQKASIQLVSSDQDQALHKLFKHLRPYSPVTVTGTVQSKAPPKAPSRTSIPRFDHHEIKVSALTLLNEFPPDLHFSKESTFGSNQRHLEIRHSAQIRDALTKRYGLARAARNALDGHRFTEVETPLLFKSTPEGAREFLVPTRMPGHAYALPQSPQQYKQILMSSGITRYYQFARCFRDEDLRADRQPEFTQLDLEMAFATGEEVMEVVEDVMRDVTSDALETDRSDISFRKMSYEEAMSTYGSDKPDISIPSTIFKIGHVIPVDLVSKLGSLATPIVEAFIFRLSDGGPAETRKFVSGFMDAPDAQPFLQNPDGQPGIFIFDSRKPLNGLSPFGFEAAEWIEEEREPEDGDIVVVQVRKDEPFSGGSTMIGNLRLALHTFAIREGHLEQTPLKGASKVEFLWINQFPLFSPSSKEEPGQGGAAGIASTHHPFTAPASAEDIDLLLEDPMKVKADHYDLVLNGVELGGGSRRIHNHRFQAFILRDILKMDEKRLANFDHLLEVLRAGCPPHAGFALGFDRVCAVLLGKGSIRDVIAFPKNGSGQDLLVESPSRVTKKQLEEYHLQLAGKVA